MVKVDTAFRSEFEQNVVAMFPDTVTSGTVSTKQLVAVMKKMQTPKYPRWLMRNKIGRAMFSIGAVPNVEPVPFSEVAMKSAAVVSIAPQGKPMIPAIDENYVAFGNHKDVEMIIKSRSFYPAYISGPTGNGKSTMVEQVCAQHKKSLIRINLNMMTDEEQLIGSKTLVNGNVEIVEGPVLIAMRTGATLLLDEIDAGGANTLLCLQPILEGKPFYFKLKNEMITPAPGFNVIATANTKGKGSDDGRYIGTNILNEAFLERFAVTFNQEYPSSKVELKIITNLMTAYGCMDQEYADTLVKWADAIRRTFADGGIDEVVTTRRMVHIIRAFSIFKDKQKAIELCCNRFDEVTRAAFIDLFGKLSTPAPFGPSPADAVSAVEEVAVTV